MISSQYHHPAFAQAFPNELKGDLDFVIQLLAPYDLEAHQNHFSVQLNHQILHIPERIYIAVDWVKLSLRLTAQQKTILYCCMTRHHNGFIRQHALELLIEYKNDSFILPYVFRLLGEYVIEILYVASRHITPETLTLYQLFIKDNVAFCQRTKCQMVSYWNEYYRQYKLKQYIGTQIFNHLNRHSLHSQYEMKKH